MRQLILNGLFARLQTRRPRAAPPYESPRQERIRRGLIIIGQKIGDKTLAAKRGKHGRHERKRKRHVYERI